MTRATARWTVGAAIYLLCAGAAAYAQWEWSKYHTQDTLVAQLVGCAAPVVRARLPARRPKHVIIVIEENKSPHRILGNPDASFINLLAARGAVFTRAEGVAHPSQPNYLALLSGRTNVDADNCPPALDPATPSLVGQLMRAHLTFAGFAEDQPRAGFTGCSAGDERRGYVRKHAPWVNFADAPPATGLPLRSLPSPGRMPSVAFIIPNLGHDMHNGSIIEGDAWLRDHVGPMIAQLDSSDAWLMVTFDESDEAYPNNVPLVVVGAGITPGPREQRVTHYDVLRTIEDIFGLPALGGAAGARGLAL